MRIVSGLGPLLAVLEAAGVAEGRTAAGHARKVLVDCARQRAAEPNRVAAPMNNSGEQLENETWSTTTASRSMMQVSTGRRAMASTITG